MGDGEGPTRMYADHCPRLARRGFVFPSSSPVAGFLHVFSNAMTTSNKALEHYEDLKVLETFLVDIELRFFVPKCIDRSVAAQVFWGAFTQRHSHWLYDKRWAEVALFCEHLLEVLRIFRSYWDLESMGQLSSGSQTEIDPQRFDMIAINNFVHACLHLIIQINYISNIAGLV